jgi:hypothetical protein
MYLLIITDITLESDVRISLANLVSNLLRNQFIVSETSDPNNQIPYQEFIYRTDLRPMPTFPIVWYICKNNQWMKLILAATQWGDHTLTIMSETMDGNSDISFYIECCLQACENFIIYDLKSTKLIDKENKF